MSKYNDDNEEADNLIPSLTEQIKLFRQKRIKQLSKLFKTTEHNVNKRIYLEKQITKRQISKDIQAHRLELTLNREVGKDIFQALDGFKKSTKNSLIKTKKFTKKLLKAENNASNSSDLQKHLLDNSTWHKVSQELENEFAVSITLNDYSIEANFIHQGNTIKLASVAKNIEGYQFLVQKLNQERQNYIKTLSRDYLVQILQAENSNKNKLPLLKNCPNMQIRRMDLSELLVLHEALELNCPFFINEKNKNPFIVAFINSQDPSFDHSQTKLYFSENLEKYIFIGNDFKTNKTTYDKNKIVDYRDTQADLYSPRTSLMRTFIQLELIEIGFLPIPQELYKSLGWQIINSGIFNDYSKLPFSPLAIKTKNNQLFMPCSFYNENEFNRMKNREYKLSRPKWYLCNQDGLLLNHKNAVVSERVSAFEIDETTLLENLLITQPTNSLFLCPEDLLIESLLLFRLSESLRANLAKKSPQLYNLAKEIDNYSINKFYKNENTRQKYLRLPSGKIVENTQV